MSKKSLSSLKMKLIAEDNFVPIMEYFFDHFAENAEFMSRGGALEDRDHRIFDVVPKTAAALLQATGHKMGNMVIAGLTPVHLPEEEFIHGSCILSGRLVVFFYFEDVDVGLLCIPEPDGLVRYARLTMRPMRQPDVHR